MDPLARLTAREAFQHPFIKVDLSSRAFFFRFSFLALFFGFIFCFACREGEVRRRGGSWREEGREWKGKGRGRGGEGGGRGGKEGEWEGERNKYNTILGGRGEGQFNEN
jgi:hypothetical protein